MLQETEEEIEFFFITRHYNVKRVTKIELFERTELVVKVYCNLGIMTEKSKTGTISDVLRKEINGIIKKQVYMNYKRQNVWKTKIGTKIKGKIWKIVVNMVDINQLHQ